MTVLWATFDLRFEPIGDCLPAGWLCCGADPFQEDEAAHVVDDIGEPDPHGGSTDTDSPDKQPRL
ncbi:hypothetical protein AA3271_2829 [Gluconobacter japonicus NBRC 3271]|nr:hypothetical protein AA3271_2829 [Gluconobacter japonicus NBRC 3271]